MSKSRLNGFAVPVISVIFGLVLGAIVMLVSGYNPVEGYSAMLNGALGRSYNVGEVFRLASPLILTALGFSVAYTAGFFNIGLAGQALCGWLVSVSLAQSFPDMPRILLVTLCLVGGAVAGGLYAGIAGFLRAKFGTSEVIVTIMLNYTILYISNHMVRYVLTDNADATPIISENASLRVPFLQQLTGGSRLNAGIFIAIAAIIVIWILMKKTTAGFELRSVGINPFASQYAGMNANKNIVLAMVIAGALAGLGGVIEGLGTFQNIYVMAAVPEIGFDGMAVSLLGSGHPIGIFISAILFGILKVGGLSMPGAGIPKEVVEIVIASIIFFVGASYVISYLLGRFGKNAQKGEIK
ncbi:ABC transporter permease [Vagococcus intermedius]|uniref:ABC transporter permease n=1 Tax=Vagococcus intermedius TaxID=2991418 RepID=A0AAF0CUP7_9ENTE|nr:ABC transporter permease [Vagococcus intermedius]WEG73360.1 ABC transporter permease [Vagococcus intermedius]WEG75441.1 ABC transporter permease [Vagococcus intermedius]